MKKRIESLQVLRGLALVGVFLLHAGSSINWSDLAVCVFFVLSGFLLVIQKRNMQLNCSLKNNLLFSLTRISKIYPLHIITMLLVLIREVAIWVYTHGEYNEMSKIAGNVVTNVLLIQAWFPQASISCALNGVAWFLSAMMFIYFMFPVILRTIQKIDNMQILILTGFGVYLGLYIISILGCLRWDTNSEFYTWATYISPIYRLGDFYIGCIAGYCFINSKNDSTELKATFIEVLVFSLTVLAVMWKNYSEVSNEKEPWLQAITGNHSWIYIPIAVMLVLVFAYKKGMITKGLTNRIMIYLGDMSPYMFLIHLVVIGYSVLILVGYFNINNGKTIIRIIIIGLEAIITLIATKVYIRIAEMTRKRKHMKGRRLME